MSKLILIGIDAASWNVIRNMCSEGKLPVISDLMKNGVYGPVKSLPGYKSPSLWASIATGCFPEENGITNFSNLFLDIPFLNLRKNITDSLLLKWPYMFGKLFSKDLMRPSKFTRFTQKLTTYKILKIGDMLEKIKMGGNYFIDSSFIKKNSFWDILDMEGISCAVIGWLFTWPAQKSNSIIITERASKNYLKLTDKPVEQLSRLSFPGYLTREIQNFNKSSGDLPLNYWSSFFDMSSFNKDEINLLTSSKYSRNNFLGFFAHCHLNDLFILNAGEYVKKKFDPEVFTIYLPGLDGIQHAFWKYYKSDDFPFVNFKDGEINKFNIIEKYYIYLDTVIKKFIEKDASVMVLSDHGMESILKKHYNFNSIRSGQHEESPDGFFVLSGPNIKSNILMEDVGILDIAPTLLYAMQKDLDSSMIGNVLLNAFKEKFVSENSICKKTYPFTLKSPPDFYSKEEHHKTKERLKVFGYID